MTEAKPGTQPSSEAMPRREALRRLSAAGLAMALLGACTGAPSPASGAPSTSAPASTSAVVGATSGAGKTKAIVGIVQEPTALDPTADATASIATCLRDNLYEGLVRLDANGKVLGSLASAWDTSLDGTTFTFHLARGVTFHDGSPFTAQDVVFSWQRAMDSTTQPVNPHRDYWAPVASVEAVDDSTVKVSLSTYSDNWLFHMGAGSACIVSSKSAANNKTNPVGTGPFKFGTWNRGASLALTRNDAYWGTKATLSDVEFRFIGDPQAMNNALKAGDIDAIGQVQGPEQLVQFQQDPSFTVITGAPAGKVMVSVNESSGPLADARVRQALYAAIDRKAWIDGVQAGYGVPIGSHATPNDGEPYYADMTSINPYDPDKAMQLLSAAGQSKLSLRLAQISAFPYAVRGTDILASQLQAIGVSLQVQPMEFPRWLQQVFGGAQDYDLTIINHVEERDIGNYANPSYYWHYANPQVADWLTQADAEPDASGRNGLYAQVQQQLANDAANLWLYAPYQLAVLKHSFQGFQVPGISPSLYLGAAAFA
jgi:peptide/nickel transport system substrate-binding protein